MTKYLLKLLKIIIVLNILVLFSTCQISDSKPKIGFLFDTFQVDRWKADRKYFQEEAEKLGAEVIIKTANGNELTQYKQATELINQGVNVLVINAINTNTAAAMVRDAHKKISR